MDNNKYWKGCIPGWGPELDVESDKDKAIKDITQHILDKQERELFAMVDNAINMKLEGKNISEWRETAKYLSDIAEQRLVEIERLQNVVVERGAKLNRQGREIADRERLKEESRDLASRRLLEISNLSVRIQQAGKENQQLQTDNDNLRKDVAALCEQIDNLKDARRWEVAGLNKKVDMLHEAYREKLDRLHEACHEKDMELRELQANKEPADWSLSTFVEAVIQRKLTGMEKELLKASEALRAMKEES